MAGSYAVQPSALTELTGFAEFFQPEWTMVATVKKWTVVFLLVPSPTHRRSVEQPDIVSLAQNRRGSAFSNTHSQTAQ